MAVKYEGQRQQIWPVVASSAEYCVYLCLRYGNTMAPTNYHHFFKSISSRTKRASVLSISSDLYGRTGDEEPLVDAPVNGCGLEVLVSFDVEVVRVHAVLGVLDGDVFTLELC